MVEAKSGYGLTMEDEIKSLEAIQDAARHWPGEVTPTLLAAHVVPQEYAEEAGRIRADGLRRDDPAGGPEKAGAVR